MKINSESYFTIAMMSVSFAAGVYALMKWDFKTALVPVALRGGNIHSVFLPAHQRAEGR